MAKQWIDAATAVGIIVRRPDDHRAMRSLCARAHAGLVETRARLFISSANGRPDRRATNAAIPSSFWWAKGHEALDQNWASGDFATWLDRKVHLRAYGVSFGLSGVLDMLSTQYRAAVAQRLSVVGNEAWVSAREAVLRADGAAGQRNAAELITEYARLGLIAGRAISAQRFVEQETSTIAWEEREWDIPGWFWDQTSRLPGHEDWNLGQFGASEPPTVGAGWMRCSGVHFMRDSLDALLPPATTAVPAPLQIEIPEKHGGRPPQAWWDDMWCELWALIYQGDFKPMSQADVERAMLTWAERKGQSLAETTARPKARKLYNALRGEAENFLDPRL